MSGTKKPPNAEADNTADSDAGNRRTGPSSGADENQGRNSQGPAGVIADYAIYNAATGRGWLAGRGGHGGPSPPPAPPGPAPATAPTAAPGMGRGRGVSRGSSGGTAVDASFIGPRVLPQQQQGEGAAPAKAQELVGGGSGGEDKAESEGSNQGGKGL
ncbi:hypothetical protein DL769_008453 [Monosporascus sp. CRB-8-3]|nr:hypothetical protein DL769_008453 [Monosporascus sp. CRB-8-3]